jgi:hypothetical protein
MSGSGGDVGGLLCGERSQLIIALQVKLKN